MLAAAEMKSNCADVEFIEQGVIEKKEATVTDEHMPERTLDTVSIGKT